MEGSERSSSSGTSLAQQYEIGTLIGGGKCSRVFAARCKETGSEVALKVVSKRLITTPAAPLVGTSAGLPSGKFGGPLAPPPPRLSEEDRMGSPWPSDELSVAVSTRLKRIRTEYYVLLEQLREEHPLLVEVERIGHTSNFLFFAMRRYRTGSLGQFLSSPNSVRRLTLSEDEARFVLCEVLLALEYLHFRGIVYRDLKPENILLTDDLHCVLSDFDLCYAPAAHDDLASSEMSESQHLEETVGTKSFVDVSAVPLSRASVVSSRTSSLVSNAQSDVAAQQTSRSPQPSPAKPPRGAAHYSGSASPTVGQSSHQRSTSFVGTLEYLSPDVLKDDPVSPAIDMWSLGMLLYELLFGFTLFRGNDERDTLFKINEYCSKGKEAKPSFPIQPSVTDEARDLLSKLLLPSRNHRLNVEAVREHAWIRKVYPPAKLRNIHRSASPLHSVLASKAVHRDACGAPSKHYDKYFRRPLRQRAKEEFDSIASAMETGNEHIAAAREEESRKAFSSEMVVDECVSTMGLSFFIPVAKHRSGAAPTRTTEELTQLFSFA